MFSDVFSNLFLPFFLLQLWALSQRCEARKHSHQSEWRFTVPICSFEMQQFLSQRVERVLLFFFKKKPIYIYLYCSKTVWSLAILAHVAVCTPSPLTQSTSPHAGTEPRSASSLTATTALRWTCGAPVVSSLRSWGRFLLNGRNISICTCWMGQWLLANKKDRMQN